MTSMGGIGLVLQERDLIHEAWKKRKSCNIWNRQYKKELQSVKVGPVINPKSNSSYWNDITENLKARAKWFIYLLRMPDIRWIKRIFEWASPGKCKQGRPRHSWNVRIRDAKIYHRTRNASREIEYPSKV